MNILLLASHAVAEYDDVRMFTDLGYDVFCPGGYQDPTVGAEGIRPGIPNAPVHPELIAACEFQREALGDPGPNIDWAKAMLHDDVLDWADVIICHHFPYQWLYLQWGRIRHKRVVWRTCGQSDIATESIMGALEGLQIVRYSPREQTYFESVGSFAGQDALIRFGKYPEDYGPWIGDDPVIGNVTQDLATRGDACGLSYWNAATEGLPVKPAGKGSEALRGGLGQLSYEGMLDYLRHIRVYLYTGTRPASYTLGLLEALLTGVPVLPMPGSEFDPEGLYEADELTVDHGRSAEDMRKALAFYLDHPNQTVPPMQRFHTAEMFGVKTIGPLWQDFLS